MAILETGCPCGRVHRYNNDVIIGNGVIDRIGEVVDRFGAEKIYLLCDNNTWKAAANEVFNRLSDKTVVCHRFENEHLEPDEYAIGSAVTHFPFDADLILTVGSGVLNDIGKVVAATAHKPYVIVATAPSMDGYASDNSSLIRDGIKVSLNTVGANVVIGDIDILKKAPMNMLKAGLGDILAKYISLCDWRISHHVVGTYYCAEVAQMIRDVLKRCVDNAEGLLRREDEAVRAVFEAMVISGIAVTYAGISCPVSGVEHYISHVIDMRAVEFGTPMDLHGIQCAVGTYLALQMYDRIRHTTPDPDKARAYVAAFDKTAWHNRLRELLGSAAEGMIELDKKENKYDPATHEQRLARIMDWEPIVAIMNEELPETETIHKLLDLLEMPKSVEELGTDKALLPDIIRATKDIRDKYVTSRLAFDLGVLDEILEEIK